MNLGPFRVGDPIPREAAFYSACGEAARAHLAKRSRLSGGIPYESRPENCIYIQNNTGSALDRGAIVGIGEPVITPTQSEEGFRASPVFYGEKPSVPSHLEKWAVLTEPLSNGSIGLGIVYGAAAVEVNFAYSDEPYADVKDATTANLQGAEGGCRVLWKESGTGVKWAVVQLGIFRYPILRGKLDADLNSGSSATMSVWEGSTLADSTRNVTVYDSSALAFITSGKKIASGVAITAAWTSGKWYIQTPAACEVDQ